MRVTDSILYIIKRLLMAVFVLLLVSILVFVVVRATPGDPVLNKIGPYGDTSSENYNRVAAELGLDKPYVVQYIIWVKDCMRLDFGVSLRNGVPISEIIMQKLPISFELIAVAIVIALAIGVPLGMLAAVHKGGFLDQIVSFFSTSFLAMPAFCTGLVLIIVFSVKLKLFPSNGYVSFTEDPFLNLQHLFMPAVTLGLFETSIISKHVRSQTLDVLGSNYIRTARAKGLPTKLVFSKHVLRNILVTVITVVGTELASLFGGTVICEQVFGWSGLGWYIFQSVSNRDFPAVQACVLVVAMIFVLVNLVTDILYTLIDPRVKLS